jgi:hypothetical protein
MPGSDCTGAVCCMDNGYGLICGASWRLEQYSTASTQRFAILGTAACWTDVCALCVSSCVPQSPAKLCAVRFVLLAKRSLQKGRNLKHQVSTSQTNQATPQSRRRCAIPHPAPPASLPPTALDACLLCVQRHGASVQEATP